MVNTMVNVLLQCVCDGVCVCLWVCLYKFCVGYIIEFIFQGGDDKRMTKQGFLSVTYFHFIFEILNLFEISLFTLYLLIHYVLVIKIRLFQLTSVLNSTL